jgi:deoxyribonuclease (pyrimidine dimer)
MTRINCGIPPAELTNKHLLAEHREIKRIPNVVSKGKYSMVGQPKTFTLGTGHVKFFYDKQYYLLDRYRQIYAECCKRGFNVTDYSGAWAGVPLKMYNDYTPTDRDREIVRERIAERLKH